MSRVAPKVTFGVIVLNGMPFLTYNLRALYSFAHQIIVVEGAARGAAGIAGADGHSCDGTLDELRRFAREEDPAGKLLVVTAEDEGHTDGFWPGEKNEQSRAYAARATGDYLWQVDVDEFYLPAHMQRMLDFLSAEPGVTAVTFPTLTFWGAPDCRVDGWFLRRGAAGYHRLFRWKPGSTYATHRPPTVLDPQGRDTRTVRWLDTAATARLGLALYHYSLLLPVQVAEKVEYYSKWGLYRDSRDSFEEAAGRRWLADSYVTLRRPYRVHNVYRHPSWLRRFRGPWPPQIACLWADISAGGVDVVPRPMEDAERLLGSPWYAAGRSALELWEPVDRWAWRARWQARPLASRAWRRIRDGRW